MSRLQAGKQTPTHADLAAWVAAAARPDALPELKGRLTGPETTYRAWRRQVAAGHRARQEQATAETDATQVIRGVETARIPGLFQTPDYARHTFAAAAEFHRAARDVDDAVRARMRRQQALDEPDKTFRFLGPAPLVMPRLPSPSRLPSRRPACSPGRCGVPGRSAGRGGR